MIGLPPPTAEEMDSRSQSSGPSGSATPANPLPPQPPMPMPPQMLGPGPGPYQIYYPPMGYRYPAQPPPAGYQGGPMPPQQFMPQMTFSPGQRELVAQFDFLA
jgi:hypothetical protein